MLGDFRDTPWTSKIVPQLCNSLVFTDVHRCHIRGCLDNEHQKQIEADRGYTDSRSKQGGGATHNPFAALQSMLKKD